MDKSVIKNETKFKKWLPNNNVNSVYDYMKYLEDARAVSGDKSIDNILNEIVRKAIEEYLIDEKFTSKKKANDSRSAVKKYWDFLRYLGKDMKSK